VDAEELRITPYGGVAPGQEPVPLEVHSPDGAVVDPTVVVRR
jgi:hypothetical protein